MENVQKALIKLIAAIIGLGLLIACDCLLEKIPQHSLVGKVVSRKYFRMAISYLIVLSVALFCLNFISRLL